MASPILTEDLQLARPEPVIGRIMAALITEMRKEIFDGVREDLVGWFRDRLTSNGPRISSAPMPLQLTESSPWWPLRGRHGQFVCRTCSESFKNLRTLSRHNRSCSKERSLSPKETLRRLRALADPQCQCGNEGIYLSPASPKVAKAVARNRGCRATAFTMLIDSGPEAVRRNFRLCCHRCRTRSKFRQL